MKIIKFYFNFFQHLHLFVLVLHVIFLLFIYFTLRFLFNEIEFFDLNWKTTYIYSEMLTTTDRPVSYCIKFYAARTLFIWLCLQRLSTATSTEISKSTSKYVLTNVLVAMTNKHFGFFSYFFQNFFLHIFLRSLVKWSFCKKIVIFSSYLWFVFICVRWCCRWWWFWISVLTPNRNY